VFDTIVGSAGRLCEAESAVVWRFEDGMAHFVAAYNFSPETVASYRRRFPRPLRDTDYLGRIADGPVLNILDIERDAETSPAVLEIYRTRGVRSAVWVPMRRGGMTIGAINVAHREVGAFSEARVDLLRTFADQAVIAIENVRLFKELEAANRGLAAASQHKSEFLANMSHELRTPLNAIIGYSELLEEEAGDLDGGRLVPDLQKIAVAAKHQLSLINDILDLSKVEAGRMELEVAAFDLPAAIENALTLVRERAARRGITLGSRINSAVGSIRADERKIKQVLLNLLSNALKFTPEGGRIDVRAGMCGSTVEVSVADTGVGIAPEDQEAVFEEFRQVGAADRKVEGTGLGLSLARKFVELHGGLIWVKSRVGEGSTFTFTLAVRGQE
jgi:signal transduction histidine kinase